MRRYAVRFLVALLTFALGVALSLVLGLFKPQQIFVSDVTRSRRPPCPKKFRVARPEFLTVDTQLSDPVRITYLGETPEGRMKLLVENRRDQVISEYAIRADRMWASNGHNPIVFEWISGEYLGPGETRLITAAARGSEAVSLRVATVTFQSGFTWINPRDTR